MRKRGEAPGMSYRKQGDLYVVYWVARRDIADRGYPQKTQRLWSGVGKPTDDEMKAISLACQRLQSDMHDWSRNPNQKRPTWFYSKRNKVYFIAAGEFVKIGHTTGDPMKRLALLQVGCPLKMALIGTVPGDKAVERALHSRFRSCALDGEWFSLTDRTRELIDIMVREQDVNACLSKSSVVVYNARFQGKQNQQVR